MNARLSLTSSLVLLLNAAPAFAAVSVVQQAGPAPTYSVVLNFDEPGGPIGPAPLNVWSVSHGISNADAGVGGGVVVGNQSGSFPWLPNNNVGAGSFGLFFNFSTDLTSISFQAWDPSGPGGPFGGGLIIALLDDGNLVHQAVYTPAWGGVGNTWFDITTSGGTVFDDVRVLGNGFSPTTYIDNMSWNLVPGPGALALMGVFGLAGQRRRRG